ncbi:response regulator [Paenibacillus sp. YYML68]|uniref:response regulator n=1 Tax=Paenibacillus sp. YYML68 TaxID=2909250 RepID=UPI0024933EB8|nr:response regulator [Paenibacillus sp. YYML68]
MWRIMIVDDTAFMRRFIRNIVEEMGGCVVVAEASNGLEAIRLYQQHRPDLVTMDITMPEMEGVQSVQEIMRLDPKARIIMCSAMGQHRMVLDSLTAGAKDFIVKPLQKDRVMQAIINAMQSDKRGERR